MNNIAPLCSGIGFHYIGIWFTLTPHRCLLIFLSRCSNNSLFSGFKSSGKMSPTIKNYIFISPGTWHTIAIWKCRFIFYRENSYYFIFVSSVPMWACYIKNASYLNIGSSLHALFLCKLRPNYFSSFAFFIYIHWLSQVASVLVIWFLVVSIMLLVLSNLCIGSLIMLFFVLDLFP